MVLFVTRVLADYREPVFRGVLRRGYRVGLLHFRNRRMKKVASFTSKAFSSFEYANHLPALLERYGYFFNIWAVVKAARIPASLVVLEGESNFLVNLLLVPLLLLKRTPYVWWTLGSIPGRKKKTFKRRMMLPLLRLFLKKSDHVATYSSFGRDYLMAEGVPSDKIVIAHNALGGNVLDNEPECRELAAGLVRQLRWGDRLRVAYIGALLREKRPSDLVRAAARFQELGGRGIGLIFVGDGPEKERTAALSRRLDVDALFAGRQTDRAGAYLLASHVVVVPGLGGLAINHAMMFGRPVIAGRADGTERDLVVHGRTGFLLDPLTPESLASCLDGVSGQPDKLLEMGEAAREHVFATATIDGLVAGLLGGNAGLTR